MPEPVRTMRERLENIGPILFIVSIYILLCTDVLISWDTMNFWDQLIWDRLVSWIRLISRNRLIRRIQVSVLAVLTLRILQPLIFLVKTDIATYFRRRNSPYITNLAPQLGSFLGDDVVLHGKNFPENPRVFFGEKEATVRWSNANFIYVKAPSSDRKGPVPVKLQEQEINSAHQYTYEETKLSVSKAELSTDSVHSGKQIVIRGTGFRKGMSVLFGSEPATDIKVVSDRKLRVSAPATPGSGTVELKVITPDESQSVTTQFKYPVSTIYNVTPLSGGISGGGWIDVYGEEFVRGQDVMFGDVRALEIEFISPSRLRARVPRALQPGFVWLGLSGRGYSSCQYEYVVPRVTGWRPLPSGENDDTTITITGEGFRKVEEVVIRVGRTEVISDTELRVHIPLSPEPGSMGLSNGFTPLDVSFISRVTEIVPASGSLAGGNRVAVIGEGFKEGHEVKFGENVSTDVEFKSNTVLLVRVPPSAVPGPVPVVIKGIEHAAGTDSPEYNYEELPSEINAAVEELQEESEYLGDAPVLL